MGMAASQPYSKQAVKVCCRLFSVLEPERQKQWKYQALHELGHSRLPFSPELLAHHARTSDRETWELLRDGIFRRWIKESEPLRGQYVGLLPKKRQ
jgi:hypothetical protein